MRRLIAFVTLSLAFGFALRADDEANKAVIAGEEALKKDVESLEQKMIRVADKLKERNPYYAEKLLKGFEKVKKDLVQQDIAELIDLLKQSQLGNATDKAEEIESDIASLLAFLEDRKDTDEMKRKLEDIRAALKAVRSLSEEHRKALEEMRKFNAERDAAVAEFKQQLDQMMADQRKLSDAVQKDTPEELGRKIDEALAALQDLMKDQEGVQKSTEGAQSTEVKDLGQFLKELNSLIGKQERALAESGDQRRMEEGTQEALEQIERLTEQQKELAAKTSDAALTNSSKRMEVLAGNQGELAKQAEAIAEKLADMPDGQAGSKATREAAKQMAEALRQMQEAQSDLENETANLARSEQDKAIEALEKAKEALKNASETTQAAKAGDFDRMSKAQQAAADQAGKLAQEMKQQAQNHPNLSMKDALERGGAETAKAAKSMQQAREALSQQSGANAEERQKEALKALKDAKAELERLSNQLAQKNKPKFNQLAMAQKSLQDRASDLGNQLKEAAAKNVPNEPVSQDPQEAAKEQAANQEAKAALQSAGRQMQNAATQMGESQQSLSQASPSQASEQQERAMAELKKAEEELRRLKDKLANQDKEKRLKELQAKQKELEEKAKDLAQKMREASEKFAQDPTSSQAMQNASEMTMGAKSEMNKASQQMGQKNKPQARQNQENAMAQLQKAKEELDKLTKQELTAQQKRELERLARRLKEMEKKAKDLAEQTQKMGEKKASESLSNAGQKMDQAGQQSQQGQSQQAQESQEQAQQDLEEAEQALEEAERQYASLMAEEKLAQMENTLGEILYKQKKVNEKTIELETARLKNGGSWTRQNRIKVQKLGDEQGKLAQESENLLKKMEEEDSTVFSWVMQTAIDDMNLVKDLLRKDVQTDEYTQGLERDIERKLQELLDALRKEMANRKKKRGPQSGGGGGGGGRLVPPIAELKMLRQMQLNLKKKTEDFGRQLKKEGKAEFDEVQRTIVKRLAHEQGTLSDLTRKFAEALSGQTKKEKPKEGGK